MQLSKEHKEALIIELKNSIKEINKANRIIQLFQEREQEDFIPSKEIEIFLLEQKMKIIETAIIDNEIDY